MWNIGILCCLISVAYAQNTCVQNGVEYKDGESFMAADGCNSCFCSNGAVACTLKFCLPTNHGTCEYGGATYHTGESFKSIDGCNTCSCSQHGMIACTEMACMTIVPPP